MTTDRSVRKYIITTLLVLTGIMGLSVHSAANASTYPQTEQERIDAAVVAARCGIIGAAKGVDQVDLNIYMNIVEDYVENPEVAYEAGYTVAVLEVSAYHGMTDELSYAEAYQIAADTFYKTLGCAANVSI